MIQATAEISTSYQIPRFDRFHEKGCPKIIGQSGSISIVHVNQPKYLCVRDAILDTIFYYVFMKNKCGAFMKTNKK